MDIKLRLKPGDEFRDVSLAKPVTLEELAAKYSDQLPYTTVLAKVNGKYEELTAVVDGDCKVELLDMRDRSAYLTYQNGLVLIYLKAVIDVLGDVAVKVENSLNKGLYTELESDVSVTEMQVRQIETCMKDIVDKDVPIVKEVYDRNEAAEIWERYNCFGKAKLLRENRKIKKAKFYSVEGYRNFFYGLMVPSSGYIKQFQLMKYRNGILLRFPQPSDPDKIPEFRDDVKLYEAFHEADRWQELLDVSYLADLNDKIRSGGWKDLVLLSEALHEKKIAEIADRITGEKRRIILIAGPSSSGKTTFAKRLCIQLRVNGKQPLYLGTDDYYLERVQSPKDEDGEYNFENLDALDIELFNNHMNRLLAGEEVDIPEFDFVTGKKVFGKRITSVATDQPIVIEGIHGLNDKLTEKILDKEKFRIYISPFTQLNIDIHNRVTTTDARLIRRMVRDYEFRGTSAVRTIEQWHKVRKGEDVNIFPYIGRADVVFNSALVYELSVLRKYAIPVLEEVDSQEAEYAEAVRLLKFIEYFDSIDDEKIIPNNSIIREFIGGSIFVD